MEGVLIRPVVLTIDEVTPAFLSNALGNKHITGFDSTPIGTGQVGEVHRITLHYKEPPNTNGSQNRPATVILKIASPNPRSRASGQSLGIYEREAKFYASLAPRLASTTPVVPRCYLTAFDRATTGFTLLLEDAGPDATQGDDLAGATYEQAVAAVRELGRLQAALLMHADTDKVGGWLVREEMPINQALLAQLYKAFRARNEGKIDPETTEVCERLVRGFDGYMEKILEPGRQVMGVTHGDYRLDNMLFRRNGHSENPPGLFVVDWQLVAAGPIVSDLAYFLGGSLHSKDRRVWQAELLRTYCDALAEVVGEPVLSPAECESNLRLGCFYGVTMAIISSAMVTQTERGDRMFLTLLERNCALARDLDALVLLPEAAKADEAVDMSMMAPLRPRKEDEYRHEPGQVKFWNESWYFDFVDEEKGMAGWVRLGLTPGMKGNWYTAAVTRRGEPLLMVSDMAAPAAVGKDLAVRGDDYEASHEPIEDEELETFRVTLTGKATCFADASDVFRGHPASSTERLALDLEFATDGVPYQYRITTRYEIPCLVSGTVTIGDTETSLVAVPGQRDHSWGPRDWWVMDWIWSAVHFPDSGHHVHATELRMSGQPRMGMGYVQRASEAVEIEELLCEETYDEERNLVQGMKMKVKAYGMDPMDLSIQVHDHAPLKLVCDDGRLSMFDRAWGKVQTADGKVGIGWFEWNKNVAT